MPRTCCTPLTNTSNTGASEKAISRSRSMKAPEVKYKCHYPHPTAFSERIMSSSKAYVVVVYADYRKEVSFHLIKVFASKSRAIAFSDDLRVKAGCNDGSDEEDYGPEYVGAGLTVYDEKMKRYIPEGHTCGLFGARIAVVETELETDVE